MEDGGANRKKKDIYAIPYVSRATLKRLQLQVMVIHLLQTEKNKEGPRGMQKNFPVGEGRSKRGLP